MELIVKAGTKFEMSSAANFWQHLQRKLLSSCSCAHPHLSHDIRFPKMRYVRPAKAQTQPAHTSSLIRVFASHLNIL